MSKVVIFGGTTEGRLLHEILLERQIPSLTCVATEYGKNMLDSGGEILAGRLDLSGMRELFLRESPHLAVDATHPYADNVSRNIKSACADTGVEYLRVTRELSDSDCNVGTLGEIVDILRDTAQTVFSALGAKEAAAFTKLYGYRERVWLRILPSEEGLRSCLELGFPAKRIICMQGPFSKELNTAMFRSANAAVLVTKDSGAAGGFEEKLAAAKELGMSVFILKRPEDTRGVSVSAAVERIIAL